MNTQKQHFKMESFWESAKTKTKIPKQRKYRQSNCCLDTCSKHRVIWVKCAGAINRKPLLQLHVLKYCKLFRSHRISYMTHKSDWLRCAMCIPIRQLQPWQVFKLQRWWNLPKWLWADWRRPVVNKSSCLIIQSFSVKVSIRVFEHMHAQTGGMTHQEPH